MLMIYDPLDKYPDVPIKHFTEMCTVIYHWALIASTSGKPMIDIIHQHYGYPLDPFTGGTVTVNGVYSYPEDPDLYPICKIILHEEIIFYYEYEMMTIRNKQNGKYFTIRVD